MPNSCSAPGCQTGYYNDHSGVPIFKMPSTQQSIDIWKCFIHREGTDTLKNIYLCGKHFDSEDILDTQKYLDIDGVYKTRKIKAILKKGAIPKYLPNCPSYLSDKSTKPQRLDKGRIECDLQMQAIKLSEELYEEELRRFSISTFSDLITKLSTIHLPGDWVIWQPNSTQVSVINLTSTNTISVQNYFTIDTCLEVKVYHHGTPVILSIKCISDTRQIDTLIQELVNYRTDLVDIEVRRCIPRVKQAIILLEEMFSDSGHTSELLPKLYFILGQLENAIVKKPRRRYNMVTMILSLKSHLSSSACYKQLRQMDCISLPHESSLRRMYSSFGLDTEFLPFLKTETSSFTQSERHLSLNMDEIHVKANITYKSGKFFGTADCSATTSYSLEPAKSILCFMVTSLCKKWSTVVRLLPIANPKASDLLPITQQIIRDVEHCDLFVDVIITDNYPLNVHLFKLLGDGKQLIPWVPHPNNCERSLYLIFDFVHIIKTIRNNWINQKDHACTYIFPNFEDILHSNYPVRLSKATFQDLRLLYTSEQFSVAKLAPRLSFKACWPSSLERQNVNLALRIFEETNVAALTIRQSRSNCVDNNHTCDFLSLICRVWKIFNIRSPMMGHRLNDEDSSPLLYNDSRFQLISSVICWLEYWKSLSNPQGKLTAQTFSSFRHSCIALPRLVNYLTGEGGFSYVLSSFLQNDPIEHHFGLYRQMSGSNYNVSVCQVLESERVLKLSKILKLYNQQSVIRKDRASFMHFLSTFESEQETDLDSNTGDDIDLTHYNSIFTIENVNPNSETRQALAFIGGYAAFSLMKRLSRSRSLCHDCTLTLIQDKTLEIEDFESSVVLIQLLDRGGLKWPSKQVLNAILTLWKIFVGIESSVALLNLFIRSDAKSILVKLANDKIEYEGCEDWALECTDCSTDGGDMLRCILMTASNCLLNNKAKNINSDASCPKDTRRKILKLTSS